MSLLDSAAHTDVQAKNFNPLQAHAAEVAVRDSWITGRRADLERRIILGGLSKYDLLELRSMDGRASAATKLIFYRLLFVHRNDETGACFPSAEMLAQGVGSQPRAARTQIGILKTIGWVNIGKRKSKKSGQWINTYEFPGLAVSKSGVSDRKSGPYLVVSNDEKGMQLSTYLDEEDMQLPAQLGYEDVQLSTASHGENDIARYAGNDTVTSEGNHGIEPENLTPLSSNAGASASCEEKEKGNSIFGETGQSGRSKDHPVQSSKGVPMHAQLRKLDQASKLRWVQLGKDAGLDEDQAIAIHSEFVAAHLDQMSEDWTMTIQSWMQSKTTDPIAQSEQQAATIGKRTPMPRALRDLQGPWAETYRNVAAEFGMSSDVVEDNHRRFVNTNGDQWSGDWEGKVRQWVENGVKMAKERASRSAAFPASRSGPSSHIPPELTDKAHPNYEAFRTQLEPLAKKHMSLPTAAKIDDLRVMFKGFWSEYNNRGLDLLEAWEIFLRKQKGKAGHGGSLMSRMKGAV